MEQASPSFGVAMDPFRPAEIVPPPGIATMPPLCPTCSVFLHAINQNPAGDVLFECLADGYYAVYRVSNGTWQQRPGHESSDWKPPLVGAAPKPATKAKPRRARKAKEAVR